MDAAPLTPEFLSTLGRKELQSLAKKKGVKANTSNQQMVHDILKLAEGGGSMKSTPNRREDEDLPKSQDQGVSKGSYSSISTAKTLSSSISSTLAALKLKSRMFGSHDAPHQHVASTRQGPRQHQPVTSSFTAAPAMNTATQGPSPNVELQGVEHHMQQLHSLLGRKATANGMAGSNYCGLLLTGPSGNGKKSLALKLAHDLGTKHHLLDLATVIGSATEAQQAGDAVRTHCQMLSKRSDAGPHMLVIDHVEALAVTDHTKARACFRAKAELMVGLCQIKQSSNSSSAPIRRTPALIVVGILQGEGAVDPALEAAVLDVDAAHYAAGQERAATAVLHVPAPDHGRREAILYHMMCAANAALNALDMDAIIREYTEGMSVEEMLALCASAEKAAYSRARGQHPARAADAPHIQMSDVMTAWLSRAQHTQDNT